MTDHAMQQWTDAVICEVEGCDRSVRSKGLCSLHYLRVRRNGSPGAPLPTFVSKRVYTRRPIEDRFFEAVTFGPLFNGTPCMEWHKARNRKGYGSFLTVDNKPALAHRWLYERWIGPIPEGLHLDHLCRVRHCVNPAHLEPVTPRENLMRSPLAPAAVNARKTHCKEGHPLSGPNLKAAPSGARRCRICLREQQRERRARKAMVA